MKLFLKATRCLTLAGLVVTMVAVGQPTAAWAVEPSSSTVIFSDDFSAGLEKWQPVRSQNLWTTVDGQAEAYIPYTSTITELVPKDVYWNQDVKNIEYELEYWPVEGVDKNISFGFEDISNWYEIHFVESFYNLVRLNNGQAYFSLFNPYVMQNGRPYHVVIRFENGHITVTVDGITIANEDDWSFNHNFGKIGMKAGTGAAAPTRVRFDNVVVRSLDAPPTPVAQLKLFKQNDSRWATEEYDHSAGWSTQPTIKRWGCALSSMAMVLHAHGIRLLPDGSELNPSSLNQWLMLQADGYLGEGALNWLAVSRLTRLISEVYQTPKLEVRRYAGATLTAAQAALAEHLPVILHLEGHFVVGDKLLDNGNDIGILDPAYALTKLSQHQKPLLSSLTFTPSQTDLSYLAIVHPQDVQITLRNAQNQVITMDRVVEQLFDAENAGEKSQPTVIETLAKPETQQFTVEVSRSTLGEYHVEFLTYDQSGSVTKVAKTGTIGEVPTSYQVNYQKNASSQVMDVRKAQSHRQHLRWLWHRRLLRHQAWYRSYDYLISRLEQSPVSQKRIWLQLAKLSLRHSGHILSAPARQLLLQSLAEFE